MTKTLKRIGVIALVLAMVFSLSAVAFAVNTNGELNTDKGIESSDNTVSIAKQIVFVNAETTTVRMPNITYTYTISAASPAEITKITDKDGNEGSVKAGPIGAVSPTAATVTFADTETSEASAAGTSTDAKYASFTFAPASFSAPGIYRYKISETCAPAKATLGITQSEGYKADRYLDVYVKYSDAEHTALAIYGYVLFEGSDTDSITSPTVTMKSQGYVNTATSGQADVDVYTTQNVVIEKKTTGSLADLNHDFPLTITMAKASGLTDSIKLSYTVENNGSLTKVGTDTVGDFVTMDAALAGTVRNSSKITITGIPTGSTINVTEKNDTVDYYKVKAGTTADGEDLVSEAIIDPNASTAAFPTAITISEKVAIYFTNTLTEISPTGVVMRVAPYAAMGGAGCLLFVLSKRSKREEEDA